jgi:hypothetical protein
LKVKIIKSKQSLGENPEAASFLLRQVQVLAIGWEFIPWDKAPYLWQNVNRETKIYKKYQN